MTTTNDELSQWVEAATTWQVTGYIKRQNAKIDRLQAELAALKKQNERTAPVVVAMGEACTALVNVASTYAATMQSIIEGWKEQP